MEKTNDNLTQQERFRIFINRHGGLSAVCEKTGLKAQRLSNYMNGASKTLGSDVISLFMEHYPKFNIEWWINGKGEINKNSNREQLAHLIAANPELLSEYKGLHRKLGKVIELTEKYIGDGE